MIYMLTQRSIRRSHHTKIPYHTEGYIPTHSSIDPTTQRKIDPTTTKHRSHTTRPAEERLIFILTDPIYSHFSIYFALTRTHFQPFNSALGRELMKVYIRGGRADEGVYTRREGYLQFQILISIPKCFSFHFNHFKFHAQEA